jgi:8-oxo-dGTP pyrophosphatase MutT (NUDIX family)
MDIKDRIRSRLESLSPRKLADGYVREAAVLIPVFRAEEDHCLLLTRRTEEVQTHKGQISFPGGMREENETLAATAIRETYEEVGIEAGSIEILGRFHDYISITGYRVTPFAGFVRSPFRTERQVHEVAEILHVPFRTFLDPDLLRIERNAYPGMDGDAYFYTYGAHQVWGLTARIIKEFFDTLDLKS